MCVFACVACLASFVVCFVCVFLRVVVFVCVCCVCLIVFFGSFCLAFGALKGGCSRLVLQSCFGVLPPVATRVARHCCFLLEGCSRLLRRCLFVCRSAVAWQLQHQGQHHRSSRRQRQRRGPQNLFWRTPHLRRRRRTSPRVLTQTRWCRRAWTLCSGSLPHTWRKCRAEARRVTSHSPSGSR